MGSAKRNGLAAMVLVVASVLAMSWGLSAQSNFDEGGNNLTLPPGTVPPDGVPQAPPPPPPDGCFMNDIQTTGTGSVSAGGSNSTYGPHVAIDGILGPPPCLEPNNGWSWVETDNCPPGPGCNQWYMIEWQSPIDICQIFVDTKPIPADECGANENRIASDAIIQWWDGSAWVSAGSVSAQTDDWTFLFPGGVTTTRLRLFDIFTDATPPGQDDNPVLYEVVVYDGTPGEPVPMAPLPWKLTLVLILAVVGAAVLALRH